MRGGTLRIWDGHLEVVIVQWDIGKTSQAPAIWPLLFGESYMVLFLVITRDASFSNLCSSKSGLQWICFQVAVRLDALILRTIVQSTTAASHLEHQ